MSDEAAKPGGTGNIIIPVSLLAFAGVVLQAGIRYGALDTSLTAQLTRLDAIERLIDRDHDRLAALEQRMAVCENRLDITEDRKR